jgi:membrane protein YdbS with pleckstrin-like domain
MRTSLQKGEKILLLTHSSWTSLIIPAFFALVIAVAGVVIVYHFQWVWGWLISLLGIAWWLLKYYTWRVDIWVVTNFRVIDEAGLLNHYAKESPLDKINNVSYDQTLAGRLFNFGHVEIQTAAEAGATDYYNVNHPRQLKDTITAAQAEYKNWQFGYQAAQMAAAINVRSDTPTGNHARTDAAAAAGMAAELEKLFDLKMKGALSEEEYNRAKARLLNH